MPGPSYRQGGAGRASGSFQRDGSPSVPAPRRRDSRRRSRVASNARDQGQGYFGYRPDHGPSASENGSPENLISPIATSPQRASTTLAKIASYIGFNRHDDDEDALPTHNGTPYDRRRSRGSYDSLRGSIPGSPSISSEENWGYEDDDDDYSERASGEEGYSSSLADDTSLPPQSRPQSPHLPLIPNGTDAVFGGDPSRGDDEVKDFASISIPSKQTILLPDEDLSIRFTCYRTDPLRNALWWAGCIVTAGGLGLVGRWIPSTWVKFCGKETSFEDAREGSWLVVEVSKKGLGV